MLYRIFIFFFLVFAPFWGMGQTWTPDNTGVKATVEVRGGYKFDTSMVVPIRDTVKPSWWNTSHSYNGQIQLGLDGLPYYYYNGWHGFGGGGGSGTVTSITAGYGILVAPPGANPITSSGTLLADTTTISTKAYVNAVGNTKLNISDTAAMLAPYASKANLADTSATLRGLIIASVIDTTSLSNRINQKQNYTDTNTYDATLSDVRDTAAVLRALISSSSPDSAVWATNYRVDTAKANLRASINTKVAYADTAAMLSPYIRSASNGLTKTGQNVALGGSLTGATTITTTGSNTLAIGGLQGGTAADSIVVSDATTGVLRRRASSVFGGGSWLTTGNSGLSTSNFIGNTDNVPILFRTNNVFSGGVKGDPQYNTQLGYNMPNILNGSFNVNIGVNAGSGFSTIADRNIAIGRDAMSACPDPDDNVAIGYNAGRFNCTQSYNVVIGSGSDIRAAGVGRGVISNFFWWDDANAASGGSTVAGGRGSIGTNTPDATALLYVAGQFKATDITASSATPSVTLGTGAGTGATFSITGSNNNYTITVNTGTTPTASATVFTVTGFLTASVNMSPVGEGANIAAKNLTGTQKPLLTGTTTTHLMTSDTVPLAASTTYAWNIICTPKL